MQETWTYESKDISSVPRAPNIEFAINEDRTVISASPPGGRIRITSLSEGALRSSVVVENALTDEVFVDIESKFAVVGTFSDSMDHAVNLAASLYWSMWRMQQVLAIEEERGQAVRLPDGSGFFIGSATDAPAPHTKRDLIERADSCLGKSKPDEPVFLLCARDVLAPNAVRRWAEAYLNRGGSSEKSRDAFACASQMEDWRIEHVAKPQAKAAQDALQKEVARETLAIRASEVNRVIRILQAEGIDERVIERVRNEHDSAAAPGEG